jgi:hypothetical protein
VSIESAQIPLERVSDPRDLLANSAGAVIGPLLVARRGSTISEGFRR